MNLGTGVRLVVESPTAKSPAIKLSEHVGLIVSGVLSVFLVVKVLAVANWDPTTAKGIIAASGTTNVLVGATLVLLPTLYLIFVFAVRPLIRARLEVRNLNAAERGAAQWAESTPLLLVLFLAPTAVVIFIVVLMLVSTVVKRVSRWRASRPKRSAGAVSPGAAPATEVVRRAEVDPTPEPPPADNRVSIFEAYAVLLAVFGTVVFTSLPEPWLPTELIKPVGGESQVAYVLSQDDHQVVALLDDPRQLQRWALEGLTREYCMKRIHWWERTVMQLRSKPAYPDCPA